MDETWRSHRIEVEAGRAGQAWLGKEWLLTNGTGAYAMGTAAGINTRRYHGLLVAATHPPVGRVVGVNQVLEEVVVGQGDGEKRLSLSTCMFRHDDGGEVLTPDGYTRLTRFEKGLSVRWGYAGEQVEVTRELFIHWKAQSATVRYVITREPEVARWGGKLRLAPMVTLRDFHSVLHRDRAGEFKVETQQVPAEDDPGAAGQVVTVRREQQAVTLRCDRARFTATGEWWHDVFYAVEMERGQEDREDYFIPGWFEVDLGMQREVAVNLTVALGPTAADPKAWSSRARGEHLRPILEHVDGRGGGDGDAGRVHRALVIAADDFVVDRRLNGQTLTTILAGYPWFADWGRDTFIAMPGLLLATGRFEEARSSLKAFAESIHNGLVPNRFDDYQPGVAHYNTVDASLWFVQSAMAYLAASGDRASWDGWLAEAAIGVLEAYIRGTDNDIAMAGDGLIVAGSEQTQLTWMDAACDGVVFTPRHGKAVEINALWYSALVGMAELMRPHRKSLADHYSKLAKRIGRSFGRVFWDKERGCLCDHVWTDREGGEHVDRTLRPNQVFAVSLPHSPLPRTKQQQIVKTLRKHLLTPYGLRTLAQEDPNYHGRYVGPVFNRDKAYHQGTAWGWLIGPYAEALMRVGGFDAKSKAQARAAIGPLIEDLFTKGLGQLHEVYDAAPPHHPRGCMAQAWSVAEVLRVWCLSQA